MNIPLCIVSALFGGLSLLASMSQIKREGMAVPSVLMALGSLVLIGAVICNLKAQPLDALLALLGCAAICAAAIWNGKKSQQFHIQHHVIRILLSLLLIAGFILL